MTVRVENPSVHSGVRPWNGRAREGFLLGHHVRSTCRSIPSAVPSTVPSADSPMDTLLQLLLTLLGSANVMAGAVRKAGAL